MVRKEKIDVLSIHKLNTYKEKQREEKKKKLIFCILMCVFLELLVDPCVFMSVL